MMEIFVIILSFLMLLGGLAGCVLPVLPGVTLSFAGLLLLHLLGPVSFSYYQLGGWLLLVVLLQVLDYVTPMLGSKYGGGTAYGNRGCLAGTIVGLFFMPWGIIAGSFIGAVVGELLGGSEFHRALRAGIGSLLGFVLGTLLKVLVCIYFMVECINALV